MAKTGPVGVGIIGAGVISKTYLENLNSFADTRVVAIGDIVTEAAESRAKEFDVPAYGAIDAVLKNDDVEIVVNLTTPAAHVEVATAAILAGKHVWNEKPLSLDRESGGKLLAAAESAGLRVGCAPDTFLGAGLQSARKIIDSGAIGTPLTALVLMQSPGPESWHPNPAFLFQEGAGPLFDIGPYYLTALVQSFGPVASIASLGSKSREQRVIGSGPKAGEKFDVTVPTHVGSLARFESGQSFQSIFSFDSAVRRTLLEINGTEGTLLMPDPNTFAGEIKVRRPAGEDWELLETTTELSSRGTGVLDMARAIREDRPHRAQGALAYHVLDIMVSASESMETSEFVKVQSTVERAEPLPDDWDPKAATV
ncbi:Gfo/Idh/MocA family oxidoreductase [Microlunatus panaciterrae]|uniref:Dehydrogenase n=1 Tax=Microlunatus panaciterrae TaxID=400768 RepID=A0ABS2RMC9_9ACTN|nr:Gfo/Idh/MocA family oxidoreductase [Microlunatus panaciterrae]MBM7799752.1 putative dehydrogenase [Microlunatus panaciterrae]